MNKNVKENARILGRGFVWSAMVAVPLTLVMMDGLKKCEEMSVSTGAKDCSQKNKAEIVYRGKTLSGGETTEAPQGVRLCTVSRKL